MADFHRLTLHYIARRQAAAVVRRWHYMRTFPQGARVNFGFVDPRGNVVGLCVYGYSSATDAKVQGLGVELQREHYLEMQRLWVSDDYGHNSESWLFGRMFARLRRDFGLRLAITHAGGCKDDCGIVYQASNWLYFGASKCSDFYLTAAGEYKNTVAALRFGRVNGKGKTAQQVGEELFGPGQAVEAHRYLYAYPLDRRLRRQLAPKALPYPKSSKRFRRDQQWVS